MSTNSEIDDLTNEIKGKMIVHWNYRDLSHLPDAIRFCAKDVREIYLKENKLTGLPNWIIELVNLTHLYLHGNNMKKVPTQLATMAALTVLDLSRNGLDDLPSSIGDLKSLEYLSLDNNFLKKLPRELRKLENLLSLSICKNEFVALPEWLGSLKKLEQLRADENSLLELPNRLTTLPSLSLVSICSNRDTENSELTHWSLGVSYNLLANGPIAICGNENCGEPIFTETWLIAAISCPRDSFSRSVTIVALYCCKNCALNFDSLAEEFESLHWQPFRQ